LSQKVYKAPLISVFSALSQTLIYTARPRIRGQCIARCACLCFSFRCYSLCLSTEGWPGWVDLGGWLHTGTVTHQSTNRPWNGQLGSWDQRRYQIRQTA